MLRSFAAFLAFLILALSPVVRADEIKLKSGEVIKDCKVKSRRKTKWVLILLDGSRRTIKVSEIVEHIQKPTIGDAFAERIKKAGKKNKEALLQIGREAMKAGAKREGIKALRLVVKLERDHAEAHELMGDQKCQDGRWRNGRALEKYLAKEKEKELKAKGWKKIKGEWVDPVTAANMKAGLVKYKGRWYSKEHVANLQAGKIWHYGTWYEASEKGLLDDGKVKYKGKWMTIKEANRARKTNLDPWRLVGEHFIVTGVQSYEKLLTCLQHVEDVWAPLVEIFGSAPATAKESDKIVITVYKDIKAYTTAHGATGNGDNRCALLSSSSGGYYDSKEDAILCYYYSMSYLMQWAQMSAGQAFQARLLGYDECPSNFYDAVACYAQGLYRGRFQAYSEMQYNGFDNWKPDGDPLEIFENYNLASRLGAAAAERRFARMGFLIHFLREKYPQVLSRWVSMVRSHKGDTHALVKAARKMVKREEMTKEFTRFTAGYRAAWTKPAIKLRK